MIRSIHGSPELLGMGKLIRMRDFINKLEIAHDYSGRIEWRNERSTLRPPLREAGHVSKATSAACLR
jgi:hypothetical protein